MCGIIGLLLSDSSSFVNQMLFDGLTVLQHRGQDAAGIVTAEENGTRLHLRKGNGLVKDVFQAQHMMQLRGNIGLGHCRYPTAGTSSSAEAQPLYTNYPYGICVAHNGNLTNTDELAKFVRDKLQRHVNTDSDSELLLNIFADYMTKSNNGEDIVETIFNAIGCVMEKCDGGYAGLYLINGVGMVGFRDPHGIRPIVFGKRGQGDYVMASESVAIDTLGFELVRDIKPGEAIFLDMNTSEIHSKQCHASSSLSPCIFEYVYFARPDSIMDAVSVYETRLKMGEKLALSIMQKYPDHDIDVVIPIPDTSRTSALQAAYTLGRPFREGFIKNRYIARTFIMPGQATRKKSVRLKLNTIKAEFTGRNVLLVDDSIVRGTTAREIVQMAREAGAKKVYFTSAAPAIRYPNIYGIDIPTRRELVAFERDEDEISKHIGSDWIVYQELKDLQDSIIEVSPETSPQQFDTSCFSGIYVTGHSIDDDYFTKLHAMRNDDAKKEPRAAPSTIKKERQNECPCESMCNDTSIKLSTNVACEAMVNMKS
mmetsp:Transcript_29023/g.35333  ORF Transcript_29023/g.35333 Transcript_29023/m.35333 type:complete len:538 (+) Transcript_29023:212-1825(+)|eukprot:CAMPEP_0172498488 /NCGR_PEP_ID=MMETSP1066-20121228/113463_1 /TAXON_ID=671091 /ORGANISM="Coscinodiscus wailesii, Strain CCMP2513" /LENGTH=537 /DNA_ID=CAMNT_0013271775 /DNA_START=205 /DNA_END=1818 /DNA_ORIENTATION=+